MISYIKGKIIKKLPNSIIINNNGIGYEVFINTTTSQIYENAEIELYTYLHIRDDAWSLYGFFSWEEREFFLLLINISGIGPKVGSSIIANSSLTQLKKSIATANIDNLTKLPGIGKKTAQRIVIELKDKMADLVLSDTESDAFFDEESVESMDSNIFEGLIALGYQSSEIRKILPKLFKENPNADEALLIKKALQLLAKTW